MKMIIGLTEIQRWKMANQEGPTRSPTRPRRAFFRFGFGSRVTRNLLVVGGALLVVVSTPGCLHVETLPGTASPVTNYQSAGLSAPPRGYTWYNIGGEYVLAANLTGRVIRSAPISAQPVEKSPFGP